MEILGLILAALVGISLGLIGGGGSILTLPILVYILGMQPVIATSYSLFIVGSTSLVGTVINYKKGNVQIKTAIVFGAASISTVFFTRKLLLPIIPKIIMVFDNGFVLSQSMVTMSLFAILMFFAAVAMIKSKRVIQEKASAYEFHTPKYTSLLMHGVLIGLATGFFGAGGGFLLIPTLVLLFHMPIKQAIGTSLLIITLNSLFGFLGDWGNFVIDWYLLLAITIIAIVGIFIGSFFSSKIDSLHLKRMFGWFVCVMSVYILLKEILQF
ncbi:MAG: sulfite exporter TauE/SafE family protein [Chitinophagaceae bacterium]